MSKSTRWKNVKNAENKNKIEKNEPITNPFVQNWRETKEPRRGSQVESSIVQIKIIFEVPTFLEIWNTVCFSAQAEQHEQDLPKGLRPGTLPGGGEAEVREEAFVTKYLKDNFQKPDWQ